MADVFHSHLEWSGVRKGPTRDPLTFSRDLDLSFDGTTVPMSSAPTFRGDPTRVNPEELFVGAVSSCQALTFLFLCARKGIAVTGYTDDAEGTLEVDNGKMRMTHVTLRPRIRLESRAHESAARELVERAHAQCFIASSVCSAVDIELRFDYAEEPVGAHAASGEGDEAC
ncbi:MAG TPA: OsmC family protein [Vicinamibacterales bacterium]|nr:OsmC family protein [Vicinamibacterales bacterium]